MENLDFLTEITASLELISMAAKVFGPYKRQDKREIVIIVNDDGSRRTVSYPKYIMEQHLGRELDPDKETVDHLDFDFMNNDINNLRLLPRDEHSANDTRRVKLIKFNCNECNKEFERSPRLVRDKSKKGNTGIFCSRSCAGKYSRKLQLKRIDKFPVQPYLESEYYRRKNVKEKLAQDLQEKYQLTA